MHEDARKLCELSADLGVGLLQATILFLTFAGVLWNLSADFSGRSFQIGVGDRIDAVEKRLILATVQHTHTKEAAAEILGISVKTLYNRLRAYESGADLPRPPSSSSRPDVPVGASLLPPNPTSVK